MSRRAALLALVQGRFVPPAPNAGALRVGLEVEMIPVGDASGRVVGPLAGDDGPGTLDVLRALGARYGWREEPTAYGLPRFVLPDRAVVSYEPGGQLEWSSAVHRSLGALDDAVRAHHDRLAAAMAREGIGLLARGLDPVDSADAAPMVLAGERYARLRAHYDRRGPDGRAMMLRTAGIHVNIDPGDDPAESWLVANALAPALVAIFANSPARPGVTDPHRSHRAAIWRALDPTRTGVFADAGPEAYLEFALAAESFLLGPVEGPSRPFAAWEREGASEADFAAHLGTLFPEVRPRRYLEFRSVDALPARWAIVPAALATAAVHHAPTRARLRRELPPPSVLRLGRAARAGLADAAIADEVRWLLPVLLDALEAGALDAADRVVASRAREFVERFTLCGTDPGTAAQSRAES